MTNLYFDDSALERFLDGKHPGKFDRIFLLAERQSGMRVEIALIASLANCSANAVFRAIPNNILSLWDRDPAPAGR